MTSILSKCAGRVESMAHGPNGVVRVAGKVHFVRHVAPGDVVEFAVREDHGSYAYCEVERVIEPGPKRRTPPCPYLPRCGGCSWQQVTYEAQLAAKEKTVRDLLERVGGLAAADVPPIIPAAREFGYRRRLSLRVAQGAVGYFAAASHDLVPIERCLLAAPELEGAVEVAGAWVSRLRTPVNRIEIGAGWRPRRDGEAGGLVLSAQAEGAFADGDDRACDAFMAATPRVAGMALRGRHWRLRWGDARVRVPLIDGDDLLVSAGDFVQVNDAANAVLIRTVCEFAACRPGDRVVDLYAGAGNLSVPLARRVAAVTAIEHSAPAVEAGRTNARRLGVGGLAFVPAEAARALVDWPYGHAIDTVVLDPPRAGAAEAVRQLLRLRPRRVVYVSCNPATLARDLRVLSACYRLERVQPIDFFPQTYHLETVAGLVLTGE